MNINKEKLIEALTTDERMGDFTLSELKKIIAVVNDQKPAVEKHPDTAMFDA